MSVGVELAAKPSVVLLDEPTSGLDASSAYLVMSSVQQLARASGGKLCVIASLHQPNTRLLHLFDHLCLLSSEGKCTYFGPTLDACHYFASIGPKPHGFACPAGTTPTDHFLHLIEAYRTSDNMLKEVDEEEEQEGKQQDKTVAAGESVSAAHFDFAGTYKLSHMYQTIEQQIQCMEKRTNQQAANSPRDINGDKIGEYDTTWWRQFTVLCQRNMMVAYRDITLYWLQWVLNSFYGFMVGVVFWNLPRNIDNRISDYSNGIVWLILVGTYLQVFKVYHLCQQKIRFLHEHANHSYYTSAYSMADFFVTSFWTFITFQPGLLIGYFMIGYPAEGRIKHTYIYLFIKVTLFLSCFVGFYHGQI